jgi:hypothetical protein
VREPLAERAPLCFFLSSARCQPPRRTCQPIAGETRTSHIVIAGSFDSAYTLTVTGQTEGQPAGPPATVTAKWLGPCAADQKPGDMIMPNGMKMNIQSMQNMQKGMVPPGAAGAPPGH